MKNGRIRIEGTPTHMPIPFLNSVIPYYDPAVSRFTLEQPRDGLPYQPRYTTARQFNRRLGATSDRLSSYLDIGIDAGAAALGLYGTFAFSGFLSIASAALAALSLVRAAVRLSEISSKPAPAPQRAPVEETIEL